MQERLEEIERRLTALERRLGEGVATPPPPGDDEDRLWVLRGLERRLREHEVPDSRSPDEARQAGSGAIVFAGTWTPPQSVGAIQWQFGLPIDAVLGADWAELAPALAALGSPVRLELLRRILTGTTDPAALAGAEGFGTSGQLHHHLRSLIAAGWLRSRTRGRYEVPGSRVIPLLVALTAVVDR